MVATRDEINTKDMTTSISENHDIVSLIDMMSEENEMIWMSAVVKLIQVGKPAVMHLIVALNHESEQIRILAAGILGRIGDTKAIVPLVQALTDVSVEVQEAAREALRKLIALVVRPARSPAYM